MEKKKLRSEETGEPSASVGHSRFRYYFRRRRGIGYCKHRGSYTSTNEDAVLHANETSHEQPNNDEIPSSSREDFKIDEEEHVVLLRPKTTPIMVYNRRKKTEKMRGQEEGERERWETERLHECVKSFISSMQLIQGHRQFSQWKGSVMDSIVGAYLTQNVSDTLSSSAFMSLAAKFPARENSRKTSVGSLTARCPALGTSYEQKRSSIQRRKTKKKSKSEETKDDALSERESNSRRKRIKEETDVIHWNKLKNIYTKLDGSRNGQIFDTSDAIDWDRVRKAKVGDIAKVIETRGMNNKLAARIKDCLNVFAEELGNLDLEWIRDAPPYRAKEHLLSMRGLGLKSVECVRLLTIRQKAFPIDRNAARVAIRLGWVPVQMLPLGKKIRRLRKYPHVNSIQNYLWPRLSELEPAILYELHCQMITFAKVFCTKRNPNCNACPMRAKCKHYESAQASGTPIRNHLDAIEVVSEQMVEVPTTDSNEPVEMDIEDFGFHKVPQIVVDNEKLKENGLNKKSILVQEGETSKAVLPSEIALIPMKNVARLKTEHHVYILPDSHHVLEELEKRELDDSCPYLLSVWDSGTDTFIKVGVDGNLHKDELKAEEEYMVNGTLLIPIRTAVRGKFPLNGTFFQANEVVADDESSEVPINVPWSSICHLSCTKLYCGTNMPAICRGMNTREVQTCFRRGFVCFRGFNRRTREPKPLSAKFHLPSGKVSRASKAEKHTSSRKEKMNGHI